jgi:hypothetical protein
MKAKHDDGLDWLRDIRRKMAAGFDHDPKKAAAYYQKLERRYAHRLYHPAESAGADVHAYDSLHDRARTEIAAGQSVTLTSYRANRKRKAKRVK